MTRREKVYEDALKMIWAIGADYDGETTIEGLRGLIDELCQIASDALNGRSTTYVNIENKKVYNCFDEEVGYLDGNKIIYYNPDRNDI